MKIGIGAPTMLPGTPGGRLAEWARAAEAAGFASLNVTDRMAYENYDPFAALAVAAAVTRRIPLRTSIVLGPLRSPGLLAKSALTLDRLSDGRFELGLGVGSRPDDYTAADVDIHRRGELLDTQVKKLLSSWQDAAARTPGAIGPEPVTPGGPRLMFGGSSAATWRRVAEFGASWMCGHGGPDIFRTSTAELDEVWTRAGRPGRPTRRMAVYFAVGAVGPAAVITFIESYFGFAPFKDVLLAATPKSARDVRAVVERYADAGCDELVLFPCSGDLEQVDLLAEAVSGELEAAG
jgi:alkanesulfonate monooxygenase SsuD/methylene tetrahydromethanopterin reductase-like flavin-dependent oxidoreductase (luciferase family)